MGPGAGVLEGNSGVPGARPTGGDGAGTTGGGPPTLARVGVRGPGLAGAAPAIGVAGPGIGATGGGIGATGAGIRATGGGMGATGAGIGATGGGMGATGAGIGARGAGIGAVGRAIVARPGAGGAGCDRDALGSRPGKAMAGWLRQSFHVSVAMGRPPGLSCDVGSKTAKFTSLPAGSRSKEART